jgi:hypothetical protein
MHYSAPPEIRRPLNVRWLLPASVALALAIFVSGCKSSDETSPPKAKPNAPADVATLFRNGYAMCKLDVLATEGVAAIAAYGSQAEADATASQVSGMSGQSAQAYYNALQRLKKQPLRIAEIEVGRQAALQADPRAAGLVQPVILRHLKAVHAGIALSPADIRQDFESQRYRAYVPVD